MFLFVPPLSAHEPFQFHHFLLSVARAYTRSIPKYKCCHSSSTINVIFKCYETRLISVLTARHTEASTAVKSPKSKRFQHIRTAQEGRSNRDHSNISNRHGRISFSHEQIEVKHGAFQNFNEKRKKGEHHMCIRFWVRLGEHQTTSHTHQFEYRENIFQSSIIV